MKTIGEALRGGGEREREGEEFISTFDVDESRVISNRSAEFMYDNVYICNISTKKWES